MSLMDALLLDEYRDPNDLWLTQRADGMSGTGTANDPADGGVVAGSIQSLGASSVTFGLTTALVITSAPHGYATNDSVAISGASSNYPAVKDRWPYFGISPTITVVSSRAFIYSIPTSPQTGPEAAPDSLYAASIPIPPILGGGQNPATVFWPVARVALASHGLGFLDAITVQGVSDAGFNCETVVLAVETSGDAFYYLLCAGSPPGATGSGGTVKKLRYRFDERMASLPASAIVRLGSAPPSNPFRSRGMTSLHLVDGVLRCGFEVKNGQKLRGSGIDATTIQLERATDRVNPTGVFGRFTGMDAGIEISDLTVDSNIGNQLIPATRGEGGATRFAGYAPIAVDGAYTLQGSHSRVSRVRLINWGTQSYPEAFPMFLGGDTQPRTNLVIQDCIAEKPGSNNFHETTILSAQPSGAPTLFQYSAQANGTAGVLRFNYINLAFTSGRSNQPLVIELSPPVGDPISTTPVLSSAGPPVTFPSNYGQFDIWFKWDTTAGPFPRVVGENITIFGVSRPDDVNREHPFYRGAFPIVAVDLTNLVSGPGPVKVSCRMFNPPPVAKWTALGAGKPSVTGAVVGVTFHALSPLFGSGGLSEGNAVFQCTDNIYADTTGSTRDASIRNNYFSGVLRGVNMNFSDPFFAPAIDVATVSRPNSAVEPLVVKVETTNPHFMVPGDAVQITGVLEVGMVTPSLVYNNVFYVIRKPSTFAGPEDALTFYYAVNSVPTANPQTTQTPAPQYQPLKMARRIMVENNVFDLLKVAPYTVPVADAVITLTNPPAVSNKLNQMVGWIIRENEIHHLDGLPNLSVATPSYALRGLGFGDLRVDSNLVDVDSPYPFQYLPPFGNVKNFNNQHVSGVRVFGADFTGTPKYMDDAITAVDDVLVV